MGTYCRAPTLIWGYVGADIVDRVMIGTAEWSELFQKHDFFHRYHNYLQVIASTGDPTTQLKWYDRLLPAWFH